VLTSLLSKEKLSDTNLDLVLKSAVEIGSDYELGQILTLVLTNHDLNERQHIAFMKALNTIESTHEYGKVAAMLLRKTR